MIEDIFIISGIALDVAGTVLIAYTAIRVHERVRKEHRIDAKVFTEMKREHLYGLFGVLLVVFGSVAHAIGILLQ